MIIGLIDALGKKTLNIFHSVGDCVLFLARAIKVAFLTPLKMRQTLFQMHYIGVESLTIIILSSTFIGLALALQIYVGFHRFGAEDFIGTVVAQAIIRELGPVLTGIMMIGRAGSAMAAHLGTMNITEQIDALKTLSIDPFRYLIVPRIIASIIMVPCMTIFSMICGVMGGYIFYSHILGLNPETYMNSAWQFTELQDISGGLIKSAFFGLIMAWIASYYGYNTTGGARGVGHATTQSVVTASIFLLVANYFLSSLLFQIGMG